MWSWCPVEVDTGNHFEIRILGSVPDPSQICYLPIDPEDNSLLTDSLTSELMVVAWKDNVNQDPKMVPWRYDQTRHQMRKRKRL